MLLHNIRVLWEFRNLDLSDHNRTLCLWANNTIYFLVTPVRIELTTFTLKEWSSTNWATRSFHKHIILIIEWLSCVGLNHSRILEVFIFLIYFYWYRVGDLNPLFFSLKGKRLKPDLSNATFIILLVLGIGLEPMCRNRKFRILTSYMNRAICGPDRNRTYKLERGQIYSLWSSPPAQLIHFAPKGGFEPPTYRLTVECTNRCATWE